MVGLKPCRRPWCRVLSFAAVDCLDWSSRCSLIGRQMASRVIWVVIELRGKEGGSEDGEMLQERHGLQLLMPWDRAAVWSTDHKSLFTEYTKLCTTGGLTTR